MNKRYIVTGACGHLGNTIVRRLVAAGQEVRGLVLPEESAEALTGVPVQLYRGDVCDTESLTPLFKNEPEAEQIVIHTAGIVTIASKHSEKVRRVNVEGTANIIQMCLEHGVRRLVHVSSVHAIPEKTAGGTICEVAHFSPDDVVGLYAKTKAEATQLVLDSTRELGLDAVVVHPSGIIGPGDYGHGHLTQMVMDYLDGRLTACVKGGYDFVDVRDVADGCIAAAERGRTGECYILSNRFFEVRDILNKLHVVSGRKALRVVLPTWFAKASAPLAELYYKLRKQPPLFTRYSLYTLGSNASFSHEKATAALQYRPRPIEVTLEDTVAWLLAHNRVRPIKARV